MRPSSTALGRKPNAFTSGGELFIGYILLYAKRHQGLHYAGELGG